jgi:hypothetical protein
LSESHVGWNLPGVTGSTAVLTMTRGIAVSGMGSPARTHAMTQSPLAKIKNRFFKLKIVY